MKVTDRIIGSVGICCVLLLSGCATIVNDANIPLTFSFSDGSAGNCTFKNKRGVWESHIPTSGVYIRRSDDALIYECKTKDGREATGSVRSEMEGAKLAASVIFWDLGITDAITDKHRTYQGNVVIPVSPKDEAILAAHASGDTKEFPIEENQISKLMSAESAFNPGDMALLEFKDGSSKVITISDINERSISGYYDYKEGAYQISDVWERDSIALMKHVKVTHRETIIDSTQPKLE